MEFVINKHLIVGVKQIKRMLEYFVESELSKSLSCKHVLGIKKMKTSILVIFTFCLCISAIMARPEPDHSHESFSHEHGFGHGHGHSREDFSGEDLFDRRGGKSVLFLYPGCHIEKFSLLGYYRPGHYGNNYGNHHGGYYQPAYNPLG